MRDNAFAELIQALPVDLESHARKHGALQRARKLISATQLVRLILGYCGLDWTLREAAGYFTLFGQRLSDMAVRFRLVSARCWIKALLAELMGQWQGTAMPGHLRFVVVDGTTVQGPGAKGTWYRLHAAIDLVRLQLLHTEVTDAHQGEQLAYYPLQEGDVIVADRGYNRPCELVEQAARGVSVVVRYNAQGMRVYDETGQVIDVAQWLSEQTGDSGSRSVRICSGHSYIEAHLHARRLPPEKANLARQRVRDRARKKGRTPQVETLTLAEWVLVLSTVPAELLPTATVMELYRTRWQVELLMKRLKSLLDLNCLRAWRNGELADVYLHGKLLYAWLLEHRAQQRAPWQGLDQNRPSTPWRTYQVLHQELAAVITGAACWCLERWEEALAAMSERPRRRQLQQLPPRVNELIGYCRARGISNV